MNLKSQGVLAIWLDFNWKNIFPKIDWSAIKLIPITRDKQCIVLCIKNKESIDVWVTDFKIVSKYLIGVVVKSYTKFLRFRNKSIVFINAIL
jgi:hypothetical protein